QCGGALFHDDDTPYAIIPVSEAGSAPDTHLEVHNLKSISFRRWLAQKYFDGNGKAANGDALSSGLETLAGEACFKGEQRRVCIRVAEHEGRIYLDLRDAVWRVVEITSDGWQIIAAADCPVMFRRTRGMVALPEPTHGGSVDDLLPFINVASKDE